MKKTIFSVLVLVLLMGTTMTSCNDQLEEKAYGKSTTEEFLKDPQNFDLIVGQIYADIKWLHDHWTYWGLCTLTSDEAVCPIRQPQGHWGDGGFWRELNTHQWDKTGKAFKYVWTYCNGGAVLCNKILAQLEQNKDMFDDETYARFKGELVTVRCFYYYTLFDCFGRIPYTEDFSDKFVDLMEPAQVWEKLVTNLEACAPDMALANVPSRDYNYARATQGMAYTLLARLYLNAESYDVPAEMLTKYDVYNKCIEACDKVINSGVYQIEDDFFANFAINNGGSKENIFVIQEDGTNNSPKSGLESNPMNKLRITLLTMHYNHEQIWKMKIKPWNGFSATTEFISKYQTGDKRGLCDVTLGTKTPDNERYGWFVGPVYAPSGDSIAWDDNNEQVIIENAYYGGNDHTKAGKVEDCGWNCGARCWKYEVDKTGTYTYCENDFVFLRYADVLWMKTEALLRAGQSIAEMVNNAEFQLLRTRVGVPAYTEGDLTLEEIYDERGREFAWEMTRRRDMIRFGKYDKGGYGFAQPTESYRKWFPINEDILGAEPRWKQNTGY
ncbi:MAG: RagB/SusD family nutrient uptake outer membrane protein [Paludibacteraceae bacterium]|nr:RagB/SusD family nutrient uptake outer membrane protein [Paludibacteraceae bacterium]